MAFTTRPVAHAFLNGDGTSASGSLTFKLTARMTNDGTTIIPTPVKVALDNNGSFSQPLPATDDTDTVPTGVQYTVELEILGSAPETFVITVPSAGTGSIDLGSLLPGQQQVG